MPESICIRKRHIPADLTEQLRAEQPDRKRLTGCHKFVESIALFSQLAHSAGTENSHPRINFSHRFRSDLEEIRINPDRLLPAAGDCGRFIQHSVSHRMLDGDCLLPGNIQVLLPSGFGSHFDTQVEIILRAAK